MQMFARSKLGLLLLSALLTALLLASPVVLGHEVVDGDATISTKKAEHSLHSDSHEHLKMLTESDLKKLIFDKTKGHLHFTNKETKDDLIALVKKIETAEESEDDFRHRVAVAMAKRKEAIKTLQDGNTHAKSDHPTVVNSDKTKEVNGHRKDNEAYTTKSIQKIHVPHVLIQYCTGCGYAKYFEDIKKDLEVNLRNIQDVRISGTNYPVSFFRLLIGKLCAILFIASFVFGSFTQQLRHILPVRVCEYVMQRRAMIIVLGIVLSLLGNSMMQSGAFEVYIDGELVYSKLREGKAPMSHDIYKLILEKTLLRNYS